MIHNTYLLSGLIGCCLLLVSCTATDNSRVAPETSDTTSLDEAVEVDEVDLSSSPPEEVVDGLLDEVDETIEAIDLEEDFSDLNDEDLGFN